MGDGAVRYVATGRPDPADPSWTQRITTHRVRRPEAWETVETTDLATELRSLPNKPTLVDDVGGWLASVFDRRGWDGGSTTDDVDELIGTVEAFAAPLVLISPEVGLTLVSATESGRRFTDELGVTNQRLAQSCDQVVLVVAGLPVWIKPANTATSWEAAT